MNQLMDEIIDELAALKGAEHRSHLHQTEAAYRDAGGMFFCPGCRVIVLSRRLRELAEARDDVAPQSRFGGRSRRDDTFERLTERKRIEEAP